MPISKAPRRRDRPSWRARAIDAIGLALLFAFLPEMARARAGLVFEPHPGWIAVLVLAARYGNAGLFLGWIAAGVAAAIGWAVAGTGPAPWARLDSAPNLIAFGACLAVSWVASGQLRREATLSERESSLAVRVAEADATIEALRRATETLRARVDRTSTSLSFLRGVAAGLDGTDPVAAAGGAADLALVRAGASASAVEVGMGGFPRLLAVRDARGPKALSSLALGDADLMVPIQNGRDQVGAIALWGTPRSGVDDATAYDLAVIASWCAPALAVAEERPEENGHARRLG